MRKLGHTFVPFKENDWYGFAGAAEGSMICYTEDCVLVLSPDGTVEEISDPLEDAIATLWTPKELI